VPNLTRTKNIEQDYIVALMMGTHSRLGSKSPLVMLEKDIVELIAQIIIRDRWCVQRSFIMHVYVCVCMCMCVLMYTCVYIMYFYMYNCVHILCVYAWLCLNK
jgi:hypothetical protein